MNSIENKTPKKQAWEEFHSANNPTSMKTAIEKVEALSYKEVEDATTAEELQTLYAEAPVHSASRALALEKLAKVKGWTEQN